MFWRTDDGLYHREDGPAIISIKKGEGYEEQWCVNDLTHRIDGPAIIYSNGSVGWFINDIDITKEVEEWMKEHNITYQFDEETKLLFKLRFA